MFSRSEVSSVTYLYAAKRGLTCSSYGNVRQLQQLQRQISVIVKLPFVMIIIIEFHNFLQ